MNTFKFDKNIIETDWELPTRDYSIRAKFNGVPCWIMQISERISGDTEFNEKRKIIGLIVQTTDAYLSDVTHQSTYYPKNIYNLFDYDGYKSLHSARREE